MEEQVTEKKDTEEKSAEKKAEKKDDANMTLMLIGGLMAILGLFLITFDGGNILWNIYSSIASVSTRPESWDAVMNVIGWIATALGLVFVWGGKKK